MHTPTSMRASLSVQRPLQAMPVVLPSSPDAYELGSKIGNRVWRATVEAVPGSAPVEVIVKTIAFDAAKSAAKTAKVEQALGAFVALAASASGALVCPLHFFFAEQALWVIEALHGWEDDTLRTLVPAPDRAPLPEPALACLARAVLAVLAVLHASGRAWTDVRGKNVFVQRDGHVRINLVTLRSVVQEKTRDSLPFVAPELLTAAGASASAPAVELNSVDHLKGDVWSLGIALLELANNATPFVDAEATPASITARILSEPPPPLRADVAWSGALADFLAHCLQRDYTQRSSVDELLRHPFVAGAPHDDFLAAHLLPLFHEDDAAPVAAPAPAMRIATPPLAALHAEPTLPTLPETHAQTISSAPLHAAPAPVHVAPMAVSTPAVVIAARDKRKSDPYPEGAFVPPPMTRGGSAASATTANANVNAMVPLVQMSASVPAAVSAVPATNPVSMSAAMPVTAAAPSPLVAPKPIPAITSPYLTHVHAASPTPLAPATPSAPLAPSAAGTSSPNKSISPPPAHLVSAPPVSASVAVRVASPSQSAQPPTAQTSQPVALLGAANVPVETTLAESAVEFVVFLRTLPSTKVALRLESRTLVIAGELPPLLVSDAGEELVLLDTVQSKFEKRIVFASDIDPNSVRKTLDKESSLMTIRIRKFSHRDLGSDEF